MVSKFDINILLAVGSANFNMHQLNLIIKKCIVKIVMHCYGILLIIRLANNIIHIHCIADVYISLNSAWIWQLFTSKALTSLVYFWSTFYEIGSVKIISKFITNNQYWKMWPIKPISDYQPIIGASLLSNYM